MECYLTLFDMTKPILFDCSVCNPKDPVTQPSDSNIPSVHLDVESVCQISAL